MPEALDQTPLLARALQMASRLHADQTRKGSAIPYLSHLLAVAALVLEDGGDEETAAAALLHDAAEDQGGQAVLDEITNELGGRVAAIVAACTDSLERGAGDRRSWRGRKEADLAKLPQLEAAALKVMAADKLHNLRSLITDYQCGGETIWARFNGGRDGTLWYQNAMAEALCRACPDSRSCMDIKREIKLLNNLAG